MNIPSDWRPGLTVLSFPGVSAFPLPLPLPLPLPCPLPMKLLPLDSRGSTLTGVVAEETKDGWTAECNAFTLSHCMYFYDIIVENVCKQLLLQRW